MATNGLWTRTKALLAARGAEFPTAREIAAELDVEPVEVRSLLALQAKRGKAVRVVTVAPGPLRWRLPEEDASHADC